MRLFIFWIYGAGAAMVFIACLGAYGAMDRAANWKPAKASVSYIDRKCVIVRTSYDENYKSTGTEKSTGPCNSVDEWDKVRTKRNKVADGSAVVHLSYTAPQNGQPETAELRFDGRDDEFYQLKAGDDINILVSNSDPTKIRKG